MHSLPLLSILPLYSTSSEREPNIFLKGQGGIASYGNSAKKQLVLSTPLQFAKHSVDNRGFCGDLDFQINDILKTRGGVYRSWLKCMPPRRQARQILRYKDRSVDMIGLLEELSGLPTLSSGQILYHGGDWPVDLKKGSVAYVNFPFSTSLSSVTAASHASDSGKKSFGPYFLWVIEIGESFDRSVYVYDVIKDRKWDHEVEVLISPNFSARLRSFESVNDFIFLDVVFEGV